MSDSDEDFATYGTGLEPLDEENLPRKKPVAIVDQIVTDENGRRRFHGAFTGGFSAGYFNTVGTRDGWRPQQFKSTRISKAGNIVQRPEDFMDEEDTGEFGIAPTAIRATLQYSNQSNKGTKRERAKTDSTGPIPGTPVLRELLKPVRERVGMMLLNQMGWKLGQGVGPRLTKQEKKQKQKSEKKKVYGCALPSQQDKESKSESESSDDEYANITFAPDDYEPFRCDPKDNYFGIGYSGLDRRPVLSQHINLFDTSTFSVEEKNKKFSIKGQAFGVGAFEAEDDDIYAREDMSRYDFTIEPERKSKSRWAKEIKAKPDCIEGFVLAKNQFPEKKVFAAPVLPKEFQPIHKVRQSRFSPLVQNTNEKPKRYEMNAESRAKIINDDRPSIIDSKVKESKNTSVAAKLITRTLNLHGKEQVAERQKLEQSRPKKSAMSWLDKLSSTSFVKGETISTDPKIQGNLLDLNTFAKNSDKAEDSKEISLNKPSFADLDKQRRFEQYLNFSESERKLKFASVQPLTMSEWERDQEVVEFEKAAKLCENIDNALDNQSKEETKEAKPKVDLETLSVEDRMMAAAKMKMFGKLTRIDKEWKPAKLVCVRFNIAEPSVGVAEENKPKKRFSIFDSISWNEMSKFDVGKRLEFDCESGPSTSTSTSFKDCSISFKDNSETVVEKPLPKMNSEIQSEKEIAFEKTYEKVFGKSKEQNKTTEISETETDIKESEKLAPVSNTEEKKDLFKSIFLDSSDDSDVEVEETKAIDDEKLKAALIGKSASEQNTQRNTSPPRGVFAKLDLDSLLKRPEKTDAPKEKSHTVIKEGKEENSEASISEVVKPPAGIKMEAEDLPPDVYGPALPKVLTHSNDSSSPKPIFTSQSKVDKLEDKWVEKPRDKKKSKKEKKKHKHKERSRSKSRKKSKKEKKH